MPANMKGSNIEWVGLIPDEWEVLRNKVCFTCSKDIVGSDSDLTQLLSLTTKGIKTKRPEDTMGKVPETYDTYQLVEPDDLVMCLFDLDVSAVFSGRSSYYGMISPAYKVLKCNSNITPKFAEYWFDFVFDGRKFKHYSKNLRYTLNYDEFATLPIIVPKREVQEKITSFLDSECARIDSVIEKTQASIEEYKKLKQAIITEAVAKGIRTNTQTKDSGLDWIGKINVKYKCVKLKAFTDMISKGATPKDIGMEINEDYCVRFLKSENIVNNQLETIPEFSIRQMIHDGELKRSRLLSRDILFVIAGASIGKTAIMRDSMLPANTNQATCFIRIDEEQLEHQKYIWYILQSNIVKNYIAINAVQSAQPNISMANLGNMRVPFPSDSATVSETVSFLDKQMEALDGAIHLRNKMVLKLEEYKKSLIYEYVTGKKEVL